MRGSIVRRGEKFHAVLDLPRGADGKRKQKWLSGYPTRREAEAALAHALNEVHTGRYVEPAAMTVRQYLCDEWLPASAARVRATTLRGHRQLIDSYAVPAIGDVPLAEVTPVVLTKLPKLSLACAVEAVGGVFNPHVQAQPNDMMREAMRGGEHPFLQACFYTEHRARVALLKAAVDFACENPDGFPPYDPSVLTHDGKIDLHDLWLHALPQSFKEGITWLVQQPTFRRYALFWQQFLWGWGGYYLDDRTDYEFNLMSGTSGIPANEIPTALETFDRLFPTPEGWLTTPGWTSARRVKMVPTYFQGIGVYHRRLAYDWGDLSELKSSGYTAQDMATWNNAAVSFLT
jgi:hypothetical protein